MFINDSVNYAAKPVHTRRALSSLITNSHQERIQAKPATLFKACNPLGSH